MQALAWLDPIWPGRIAESWRRLATMAIDLRLLSMAILRGPYPKTETIPLPSLYKEKPVVLYAIRRMG